MLQDGSFYDRQGFLFDAKGNGKYGRYIGLKYIPNQHHQSVEGNVNCELSYGKLSLQLENKEVSNESCRVAPKFELVNLTENRSSEGASLRDICKLPQSCKDEQCIKYHPCWIQKYSYSCLIEECGISCQNHVKWEQMLSQIDTKEQFDIFTNEKFIPRFTITQGQNRKRQNTSTQSKDLIQSLNKDALPFVPQTDVEFLIILIFFILYSLLRCPVLKPSSLSNCHLSPFHLIIQLITPSILVDSAIILS